MELTREALRAVEFRSRGQWYQARQVDQFIEELTVAVDQAQRERDTLGQKLEEARSQREELAAKAAALEEEAQALSQEKAALEEALAAQPKRPAWEERQHRVLEDLSAERDQLIADIKALRQFREDFRAAVEGDARAFLEKASTLASEEVLP